MKSLAEMGEAARRCSNVDYQATMRAALISVRTNMERFHGAPNAETLRALNGAWANATRVYANTPPEAGPTGTAGATEPARLAA